MEPTKTNIIGYFTILTSIICTKLLVWFKDNRLQLNQKKIPCNLKILIWIITLLGIAINTDKTGIITGILLIVITTVSFDDERFFKIFMYFLKAKTIQEVYRNGLYKKTSTVIQLMLWIGPLLCKNPAIEDVVVSLYLMGISDCFQCGWGKASPNSMKWTPFSVSPNKSINGYIGALMSLYVFAPSLTKELGHDTLIMYLVGILGDLNGSYIKRKHTIKDYGTCLGSMGGVLDRIDSHMMVLNYLMITPSHI